VARAAGLTRGITLPAACVPVARRVDAELERFLAAQRRALRDVEADAEGLSLFDELERVIAAGGKRLRPVFCVLGHLAAGGDIDDRLIRAASALELLHTFAIVHDDVMDRSRTRRGRPASWVFLADEHRRAALPAKPGAFGVAAAILLGDLAIVLAGRALRESGYPDDVLMPAMARYDRMRAEVVAGQYLDVLAAHRGEADEREARRIAVLKSGGYTVQAPLQIGAILAGAGAELLETLSTYGVALGEAFQLRDDVLGVFGDPEVTGKDRESDLREGKRTVLLAKAGDAASAADREFLTSRLGRPEMTQGEVDRARDILETSGALRGTLELIDVLVGRAKAALEGGAVSGEARPLLLEMADHVAIREL